MDVHDSVRRLERALLHARERVSAGDVALIERFVNSCRAEGLSNTRLMCYVYKLIRIRGLLGKGFAEAGRGDVEGVVARLYAVGYRPWTIQFYKVTLKKFYRWLRGIEQDPPEVAWITLTIKENERVLPEDILTADEVKKLVASAFGLRDKAFIGVGYEGGLRPGEMLTLRIRSVEFDDYGGVVKVRGKTGPRRVRVVEGAVRLQAWVENHPFRGDPDAWLWVNIGVTNKGGMFRYPAARKMLREVATRAGITKRVNPYSLRHARATHLAKVLTESQLCEFFGWIQGSKAPQTYVHLSGRDVDDSILAHYGLVKKEELESPLKPKKCPRCNTLSSHDAKYCRQCNMILDPREALRVEADWRKLEEKIDRVLEFIEAQGISA